MRGFIPPQNSEEIVFAKKSNTLLQKAESLGYTQYTLFMDIRQQQLFSAQANKFNDLNIEFIGGYEGDAERKIAKISCFDSYFDKQEFPVVIIHSKLFGAKLSHKDFLGAIMSLKIKRDYIGDIIVKDDDVFVITHKNVANILVEELCTVNRYPVKFNLWEDTVVFEKEYSQMKNFTVASMRLDGIISGILNCSRSEAVKLIKQGAVKVNQMEIEHSDFEMFDNDIISVSRKGKFKIFCEGNKSRKDRIFIKAAQY